MSESGPLCGPTAPSSLSRDYFTAEGAAYGCTLRWIARMTATTTLAHAAPSIPSGLRTSGHATPSHGSRSNTPMRIKRVIPSQFDAASAPLVADLDVGEEDRHVRRSNSAQTLESSAMHHHLSRARRRHLSVTTYCDKDAAACRDPSLTLLGGILARRQEADGPLRQSPSLSTVTAASPIHALQMKLGEYAVLGPDASVALAYSQIMDPAVQCVVISVPGTAHVLTREVRQAIPCILLATF